MNTDKLFTAIASKHFGVETLKEQKSDRLDFHDVSVIGMQRALEAAYEAGKIAAKYGEDAILVDPTDTDEILGSLTISKIEGREIGGRWVTGHIAGHKFQALVFPEHAEKKSYEMSKSKISKFWLKHKITDTVVANFDRGWDTKPTTDLAVIITDLLAAGLADTIFTE